MSAKKKKDEPAPISERAGEIEKKIIDESDPLEDLDPNWSPDSKSLSAVNLKLKGASYNDIARVLEYPSAKHAENVVLRVLAAEGNSFENIEAMRKIQNKRFERMLWAVMPRGLKEDDPNQLAYHARALAVMAMINRINGLDAAQQVQITASDETIKSYVGELAARAGYQQKVIEGEIIDLGENPDPVEGQF